MFPPRWVILTMGIKDGRFELFGDWNPAVRLIQRNESIAEITTEVPTERAISGNLKFVIRQMIDDLKNRYQGRIHARADWQAEKGQDDLQGDSIPRLNQDSRRFPSR